MTTTLGQHLCEVAAAVTTAVIQCRRRVYLFPRTVPCECGSVRCGATWRAVGHPRQFGSAALLYMNEAGVAFTFHIIRIYVQCLISGESAEEREVKHFMCPTDFTSGRVASWHVLMARTSLSLDCVVRTWSSGGMAARHDTADDDDDDGGKVILPLMLL